MRICRSTSNVRAIVIWQIALAGTVVPDMLATRVLASFQALPNVPANNLLYPAGSPPIDACPNRLPTINGVKYVADDVAAWTDLCFYSSPIYVEVIGSRQVGLTDSGRRGG